MVTVNGEWVEFRFFRPNASRVHLAGDFNNWRHNELPMTRGDEGYWHARVRLNPGEFKFRYCADGQWFADYAAFGVEPGRFGMDSIVRVEAQMLKLVNTNSAAAGKSAVAAA